MKKNRFPVISLFTGAMGLDLGLEQAGFEVRVAVECSRFAAATIRRNRPNVTVIEKKIEDVSTDEILRTAGLEPGEPAIVTGGPSCQAFSTAGQRGSLGDPRGVMFKEFLRVVKEARPRFFVLENVRGILSAAVQHRPLKKRGPGWPHLSPDEELGSAFLSIIKELKKTGYYIAFDLLNAANFGVPQIRERVMFIGSRDGVALVIPERTHAKLPVDGQKRWLTLKEGLKHLEDSKPAYSSLTPSKKKYLSLIPEGGNWRDLPPYLQSEAIGGAFKSWGGRSGFMRRLSWDRPAPSLTTRPDSKATMLCHPTELRPLSIKEYARLQQFPDDWEFVGGTPQQYLQIGNAVPVGVGKAVGLSIRKAMRKRKRIGNPGSVVCVDKSLAERLSKRPGTVLNPPRMRKSKSVEAGRKWLSSCTNPRSKFIEHIDLCSDGKQSSDKLPTRDKKP